MVTKALADAHELERGLDHALGTVAVGVHDAVGERTVIGADAHAAPELFRSQDEGREHLGDAFELFGVLGIGGVISFVIGSIILIDTDFEGYGVSIPFIASFAVGNALFFATIFTVVLKARKRPVVSGIEQLVGSIGEVLETDGNDGRVRVHSEDWLAKAQEPMAPRQKVRVIGVNGLTLLVEPEKKSKEGSS